MGEACINPPKPCPPGYTGQMPLCVGTIIGGTCPPGSTGVPPACVVARAEDGRATVGLSGVASSGVAFAPDPSTLSPNAAVGNIKCDGHAALSMACVVVIVGKVHYCQEVEAKAMGGFITAKANVCVDAGGGAWGSATGSLMNEYRTGHATANGHRTHYVKDYQECQTVGHGKVCKWHYKPDYGLQEDKDDCLDGNIWAEQSVAALLQEPKDVGEWLPWWHGRVCAGQASVVGVFDCIDATADAFSQADPVDIDDATALPSCTGHHSATNTRDNAEALQETTVFLNEPSEPSSAQPMNASAQRDIFPVSSLNVTDQLAVKAGVRGHWLGLMNQTLDDLFTGWPQAEPDANTTAGLMPAARAMMVATMAADIDASLAEDFLVRLE